MTPRSGCECGSDFSDARARALRKVMFPNPHDPPTGSAERPAHQTVSGLVGCQLLRPEWPVAPWHGGVFRATVPKAAVHENGDSEAGKGEVGLAKVFLMSAPAGDAMQAEDSDQGELRILVSVPANSRHHVGALRLGEYVGHSNLACCRGQQLNQAAERDYPKSLIPITKFDASLQRDHSITHQAHDMILHINEPRDVNQHRVVPLAVAPRATCGVRGDERTDRPFQ